MQFTKNTKVKHFTDLLVWQKAHKLFVHIYKEIERFPRTVGAKIIADQILRSSGSISANIAEWFNSHSTKEYIHYLDIAQRSAAETENWLYKIIDCRILKKEKVSPWLNICFETEKMLNALMKSLDKKLTTST